LCNCILTLGFCQDENMLIFYKNSLSAILAVIRMDCHPSFSMVECFIRS
jgi:hypothetical protein